MTLNANAEALLASLGKKHKGEKLFDSVSCENFHTRSTLCSSLTKSVGLDVSACNCSFTFKAALSNCLEQLLFGLNVSFFESRRTSVHKFTPAHRWRQLFLKQCDAFFSLARTPVSTQALTSNTNYQTRKVSSKLLVCLSRYEIFLQLYTAFLFECYYLAQNRIYSCTMHLIAEGKI